MGVVISGTGVFTPKECITNAELVASFNAYVQRFNAQNATAIEAGEVEALLESSDDFIVRVSGIKQRYVMNKSGILDIDIMAPRLPARTNDAPSISAEIGVAAAREALTRAACAPGDIDAIIVSCSNLERPYPAVAIEIQDILGVEGFAYDMSVACAAASFAVQSAHDLIKAGHARRVLVINPEACTGHINFRDRATHFIFGDGGAAMIVEKADTCASSCAFDIVGTKMVSRYSNNLRNNFGFLNRTNPETMFDDDKLLVQNGRRVFRDVVPIVQNLVLSHLQEHGIAVSCVKRLWLHQANSNMNALIGRKIMGREPTPEEQPNILQEYGNTTSAGAVIAFHKTCEDLHAGDIGVMCAFGAGYTAGSVILRKSA